MQNLMRKCGYLTILALLCCAPVAFSQQVTMTLQSVPSSQPNLGGVYTGAYPFTISNGTTTISTTAVCDDFNDEITQGESWTANVVQFSSLTSSGTPFAGVLFGGSTFGGGSYSQLQAYDAVADLVGLLSNPPAGASVSDISYAIWDIFDPSASNGLPSADQTEAMALAGAALGQTYAPGAFSNFEILTPASWTSNSGLPDDGRPQEFILAPESPAPILLGADLLGLAALIFLYRRRMLRAES